MYLGLGWLRSAAHWYAFMCWSVWNPNKEPWTSLEPLLICKAIAAPPARPCSASKELVTMLTSCTASRNICEGGINHSAAVGSVYRKVIDIRRRAIDGEIYRPGRVRGEGVSV